MEKTGKFWMIVLFLIIVLSLLTFYSSKKQLNVSAELKHIAEERYRLIQNINYSIKYIKGSNSEDFYLKKIEEIRRKEIEGIKLLNWYGQMNALLKKFAQPLIIATILLYYVIFDTEIIDMNTIYQMEQSFWIVRQCLNMLPILLCQYLDSLQNINRIEDFLFLDEIELNTIEDQKQENSKDSKDTNNFETRRIFVDSSKNPQLPKKVSLNIADVQLNTLIIVKGPTASGKSLLLRSILGEYSQTRISAGTDIAYVGQDNWMLNKSIKENIILDKEYDEEYFKLVVSSFDLDKDITNFDAIVNQRSDNLSGGQKQRVNVSRAFYQSQKKLILLDDSFSALDKRVMKNCIKNIRENFLKNRIVILTLTENAYIEQFANIIVKINSEGTVEEIKHQTPQDSIEQDQLELEKAVDEQGNKINLENSETTSNEDSKKAESSSSSSTLIQSNNTPLCQQKRTIEFESMSGFDAHSAIKLQRKNSVEISKFKQTFDLLMKYSNVDPRGRWFLTMANISVITYTCLNFGQTQIMKYWDSQFFSQNTYIFVLIAILLLDNAGQCLRKYFVDKLCLVSAEKLHQTIAKNTMNSHFQLYINQTITPSKIQDILSIQISNLDLRLSNFIPAFYFYFFGIISNYQEIFGGKRKGNIFFMEMLLEKAFFNILFDLFILIVKVNVFLSLVGNNEIMLIGIMGLYLYFGYKVAQNNVEFQKQLQKRLKELSGPLINYSNQCLQGLCYIRSYGLREYVLGEYCHLQEKQQFWRNQKIAEKFKHDLTISSLGFLFNLFSFTLTLLSDDPLSIGPKITFAINIDFYMICLVTSINEIQDSMQSYQKCVDYLNELKTFNNRIMAEQNEEDDDEKEDQTKDQTSLIDNGPKHVLKGGIRFNNFSAEYGKSFRALNELNFTIQPGEKVCVVGRTGSGKSTLLLSILDLLYHTSGKIEFDDLTLSGKEIRENMSIIMQDNLVFEGTVKQNIDPRGLYSEKELLQLIQSLHLEEILEINNLKLSMHLEEAGKNLSAGEKQVISILRSLIQQRKIILFDEANSSIDKQNEDILSNFLMNTQSTVIFIAHKITNVMNFHRIIYLSSGEVLEDGDPKELLSNTNSHFYKLYNHL